MEVEIYDACSKGDLALVKRLITRGTSRWVRDDEGNTLIHLCCSSRHCGLDVLQYLVTTSGIVSCYYLRNNEGSTPLHLSCGAGKKEFVEFLIQGDRDNDFDFSLPNYQGETPLYFASRNGHSNIVSLICTNPNYILHSGDIYQCIKVAPNWDIMTILLRAISFNEFMTRVRQENHVYLAKLIFKANVTIQWKDNNSPPLHQVARSGDLDIMQYLVNEIGCDINALDSEAYTPLYRAIEYGNLPIVQYLFSHRQCNRETRSNNCGMCPLHHAIGFGYLEIIKSAVVDKVPGSMIEALVRSFGIEKYLTWRLEEDQPCFITNDTVVRDIIAAMYPLHKAVELGCVDVTKYLVSIEVFDVNSKNCHSNDNTPLHVACDKGHLEIVKLLTDCPQFNCEAENGWHLRPLHKACNHGNVDIVQHLVVEKGCDVTAKDYYSNTPLHYACKEGHFEIVKTLTDHPRCNIDAMNTDHLRPLHVAYQSEHVNIVRHLVNKGCTVIGFKSTLQSHARKKNEIHSIIKYHQALHTSGKAMLCSVKCILTGPPGAGKSTLKKRLLNVPLTKPSLSSGVVDAAIQVDSFRKLQQQNAVVTTEWRTQDLDEEAVLIFENIITSTSRNDYPTTSTSELEEDGSDSYGDIEVNTTKRQEKKKEVRNLVEEMEEKGIVENNEELQENNENTGRVQIELGIHSLSKFVESIPVTKRKVYEERCQQTTKDNHAMLHIIDTGGQPEFHEMLPALITGPAINLLVFDLTIDLTSRYEITYRSSSGDSKPYQTSLTHEEVIFRSLASIACLRQNTIGWSFNEVPLKDESEPAAFLIATHRDCFPNEAEAQTKVDSVNNHLKLKIQASGELFSEDLVQYSTPDQVIFSLDTRNDQKEIEELRSLLHRVISKKFHELPVPASWCAFSLKLRKSKKPIHLLDTCYQMAKECGIKDRDDFKSVLWFLHHRVGVIMHYPEVEGLENIVITDLQLVFDRITQLITSCFTFKELGNASSEKEFHDNGLFRESHLIMLSCGKGDPLIPTRLVSLLKHLHIVAGPMKTKVGCKTEKYYFMPCALKPAPVEEEQRDESICPAPLTIYFECGYIPVGVFCCLVVYLLSQRSKSELEWKLRDKVVHHRNKITFYVGEYYDCVTLISRATYLEVWVDQITPKRLLDVLCQQIISTLHRGLETVTQSLHYTYRSHHFFGFPCVCCSCTSYPPHPAIVYHDLTAECVLTCEVMHLQERRHLVWSTKVYSLFPCIHYILCNTH